VHRVEPEGSPRNTWRTTVDLIEHLGENVRLRTGPPLPLAVEITEEATRALHLKPGSDVWLSIKATAIRIEPDRPFISKRGPGMVIGGRIADEDRTAGESAPGGT
ncbi:MAG: TOBE domain-containing protein, partial [Actinomycetota bacterium]